MKCESIYDFRRERGNYMNDIDHVNVDSDTLLSIRRHRAEDAKPRECIGQGYLVTQLVERLKTEVSYSIPLPEKRHYRHAIIIRIAGPHAG